MQQNILDKHPAANLRVYTVWFSMLGGDSRSGWHSGAMPDPRVTNLWDEDRVVSQWFSQHLDGEQGFVWDAYLLYGSEARWENTDIMPTALASSGSTIVDKREQLQASIFPLLGVK